MTIAHCRVTGVCTVRRGGTLRVMVAVASVHKNVSRAQERWISARHVMKGLSLSRYREKGTSIGRSAAARMRKFTMRLGRLA